MKKLLCTRCCKGEAKYRIVYIWKDRKQTAISCGNRDNGCPYPESDNLQIISIEDL